MPDTRPRYPEEDASMLSPANQRSVARALRYGRRLLVAQVLVTLRDTDPGIRAREYARLQKEIERVIHDLPIWLRSERFLTKHLVEPAERVWIRLGPIKARQALRTWEL